MKVHVLPGDALAEDFIKTSLEGELIVCRECLIEGDVRSENPEDFWQKRARFIAESYGGDEKKYHQTVAGEFEKLKKLPAGAQINLWFEYELFCQVNMWFCLFLLADRESEIYRVAPVVRRQDEIWKGFGGLEKAELEKCFARKVRFEAPDLLLGKELWKAFQNKDFKRLKQLSEESDSECFPYLREVCEAEIEKQTRPRQTLQKIVATGEKDFAKIFESFVRTEGVYGFGDTQVKRILQEI